MLTAAAPQTGLQIQILRIGEFARTLWPLGPVRRILHSFHLFSALEGIGESSSRIDAPLAQVLFAGTQSYESWAALENLNWESPLVRAADALALIQLCEQQGLRSRGGPIPQALLRASLRSSGRPEEHVESLLDTASHCVEHGYKGAAVTGLTYIGIGSCLVLLLLMPWAWSLGFLYAKLAGSRRRRITLVALAALTWPISCVVWGVRRRATADQRPGRRSPRKG